MKRLFKGGTIVGAGASQQADFLVCNDKIVLIGKDLASSDAEVVDVRGKLLFPGFIDAHTHFDLDVCNTTTADDFEKGSAAAVCGGTTMVTTLPARTRARRSATGCRSGTGKPMAERAATTAST